MRVIPRDESGVIGDRGVKRPIPVCCAVEHVVQQLTTIFALGFALWANMPPDSKDLSSLKDKSTSFHRLHTSDFERMKGLYLTPEELRGFDKYKVWGTG